MIINGTPDQSFLYIGKSITAVLNSTPSAKMIYQNELTLMYHCHIITLSLVPYFIVNVLKFIFLVPKFIFGRDK